MSVGITSKRDVRNCFKLGDSSDLPHPCKPKLISHTLYTVRAQLRKPGWEAH